ncbi:MAG: WXG100 family type VII secretion target [Acidimicrobiales bacterium]
MAAVAGQLNGGAGSIEPTLNQLSGQVAPLGSDWAGAAQGRFLALWQQWHTSQATLHASLAEMAQLMSRAGVAFATNDQQVAASFNQ